MARRPQPTLALLMIRDPHASPLTPANPPNPLRSLEEEIDFIHHGEALALQRTLKAAELQPYLVPNTREPISHW